MKSLIVFLYGYIYLFILATGQLSAEVIGPGGKIPVDILSKERGKVAVSFVPKAEGVLRKYLH